MHIAYLSNRSNVHVRNVNWSTNFDPKESARKGEGNCQGLLPSFFALQRQCKGTHDLGFTGNHRQPETGNLTRYRQQSSHKNSIPKPAARKKANLLANVWPPTWGPLGKATTKYIGSCSTWRSAICPGPLWFWWGGGLWAPRGALQLEHYQLSSTWPP